MADHHNTPFYRVAFQNFLDRTDEKIALSFAIRRSLDPGNPPSSSLLDIGAGDGRLSVFLSRMVSEYTAIEQNADHAAILQGKGLNALNLSFPCASGILKKSFDAVLSSHSLPWKRSEFRPFLDAAWSLTAPSGKLLVVTYDGESGLWADLERECRFCESREQWGRMAMLKYDLRGYGEYEQKIVTSRVRAKTLDEIIDALAFVGSDGIPEKHAAFKADPAVRKFIAKNCNDQGRYSFPFDHHVFELKK